MHENNNEYEIFEGNKVKSKKNGNSKNMTAKKTDRL
jgi:hypothetical protein